MCIGCSKEPSHRDGSFEYPQQMFWLSNKNKTFQLHTLIWRPDQVVIEFLSFLPLVCSLVCAFASNSVTTTKILVNVSPV